MLNSNTGSLDSGFARRRAPRNDDELRTAPRRRCDRQHFGGGGIGGVFLPAHRAERPLQHAADADRLDADVESYRAQMQLALGLRGAVALAQIVEPGRAVIALGPQFGIGDVARDRPAIGAVALARRAAPPASGRGRPGRCPDRRDIRSPPPSGPLRPVSGSRTSGSASKSAASLRPPIGGIVSHSPSKRRDEHRGGGDQQRHLDADQVGEIAPSPAADRDAAGNRGLERRQRAARDPARRGQLHADVEQRDRQHPYRSRDHQRRGGEHRLLADARSPRWRRP